MAKIFVSYSRKDSTTARKIIQALKDIGQDVWVDWEDIPPASDWLLQVFRGIEASDAFIFLISPDSATSEVCKVEVGHAAKNSKRIIPVVLRHVPPPETIDIIRKLNWTFVRDEDVFEEGVNRIKKAIELDFEWVEEHSRLQARALDWDRRKEASLLLRGRDLWAARQKIATAEKKDPKPSELQKTYILQSNRNERRNFIVWGLATIAIIALAILSYTAFTQSKLATAKAIEADQQRSVAEKSAALALENEREARKAQKEAEKAKDLAEIAREEAEISKNIAAAQRSAARAQIYQFRPGELYTSTLLAIDSWQSIESAEAEEILRKNISLLPIPVKQMKHAGRINHIEFNPEGDVFITAGADGSVCAWQVSDGKNIFCADSPGAVNDAVFSPTEKIVVTGDSEGNVQIINADSGVVETQIAIGFSIRDVDIQKSGKFAAVTSDDDRITLIDLKARKKGFFLEGTKIKFASFSPNGLQVATGSGNGLVSLWTLNSASQPLESRKHIGEILALEFSPNGFYVVTGGVDGAVVVTDTKTGKEKFRGYHDDQVKDIAFNPAGNWFVTVSNDRKIRVWDINNGRQILIMSTSNFVQTVEVSADGQWIATTGDDKTVRVWNASTGTELFQIPLKDNGTTLGFSKDGKYLIAGDQSGFINIWDISEMPAPANYLQFNGVTTSTLYSPSGGLIAASDDKRIWLLNPATLSKLTTRPSVSPFAELRSNITQLVFSPKEKWIGAITTGNDVVVYNTQNRSGKTLQPKNLVQAIVFSPDEKQLFIGDGAGNLQVWDTSTGTFRDTPLALSSRITAMTASANLLAIGTDDTVILFDLITLEELARLESSGAPELLVFSPDGSLLASNNSAGQIQVWTQKDGQFTGPNVTIKESASALAFSSSNKWLAVAAVDKVYLLNPFTLEEYARIPHTGTVSSVSFSADDAMLMTSSLKVMQFWDMATIQEVKKERIVEIACQHLIEDLTEDQWSTLFETKVYQPICGKPPIP